MTHALLALFITLAITSSASAQAEPLVELEGAPTVTKIDDSFIEMCTGFAEKLGRMPTSGMLTFKPKVMPYGQDAKSGSVWVLSHMDRRVEIAQSELPALLQRLHGPIARNVLTASCYTKDEGFGARKKVVIVTANAADAEALKAVLR